MTLEQQIAQLNEANANLTAAVNALTGEVVGKMGEIDSKVTTAEQSFVTWRGIVDSTSDNAARNMLHVDAVNGHDENSGTAGSPLKTWAGVVPRLIANGFNDIYVNSDMDVDVSVALWKNPGTLRINGWNATNNTRIQRTLTIKNSNTGSPGSLFYYGGAFSLFCSHIDFDIQSNQGWAVFTVSNSPCAVKIHSATISASATATTSLFSLDDTSNGKFSFTDTVIDSSATGKIFAGVAAGADPNSIPGVVCSLTSA